MLLLAGLGGGGWLYMERQESNRQTAEAVLQRLNASKMETLAEQRDVQRLAAESAKSEAEAAESEAEDDRAAAISAQETAVAAEEAGRKLLYATDMQLAPFIWRNADATVAQLRSRLDVHDSVKNAALKGKADLRGFEWHYHQHLLDHSAKVFGGPEDPIIDAVLASDGQLVTLNDRLQVRRWDVETQAPAGTPVEFGPVKTKGKCILSPDGQLAAITTENVIRVFDATSGEQAFQIQLNGSNRGLIFSSDGDALVTVDKQVRWWDTAERRLIASAESSWGEVSSLSADGRTLAVGGYGGDGWNRSLFSIYRLDAASQTLSHQEINFGKTIGTLAISPDGSLIAVSSKFGGQFYIYDSLSRDRKFVNASAHPSKISAMRFSPDGTKLATAAYDGTIKVWTGSEFAELSRTLKGRQAAVNKLSISRDGMKLLSMSSDKTARVWDLKQGNSAVRHIAITIESDVAFSADGLLIATAEGNRVILRDAESGQPLRILVNEGGHIVSLALSPDNRLLACRQLEAGSQRSNVTLWEIDSGRRLTQFAGRQGDTIQYSLADTFAFSPNGKHLVAGFGGKLHQFSSTPIEIACWNIATGKKHHLNGHNNACVSISFSSDGRIMATGSHDGTARLWSTQTWQPIHDPLTPGGSVHSVAFSPDGRTLASGSNDQSIRLWNTATWRELMRLNSEADNLGAVQALAFSPDGRTLLASGRGVLTWSSRPSVWNDKNRAATRLGQLLDFEIDFVSRLRMFSEDLSLHETVAALARQRPEDQQVQAALAATRANWHASQQRWSEAAKHYKRLQELSPTTPHTWFPTPGLARMARALFQEGNPTTAAELLAVASRKMEEDGITRASEIGFTDPSLNSQHRALRTDVESRLAELPGDAALLELRAELFGLLADVPAQLTDYTAAIKTLDELPEGQAAADVARVYHRRGDAHFASRQWQRVIADYTRVMAAETRNTKVAELFAIRGKAHSAMGQTDQAIADVKRSLELQPTTDTAELLTDVVLQQLHVNWTVLEPIEMKSAGGAILTRQEDSSILASGKNTEHEVYTVTAGTDLTKIAGIRLEALKNKSLPGGGPGRSPAGWFVMASMRVTGVVGAGQDSKTEILLNAACTDFTRGGIKPSGYWQGEAYVSRVAFFHVAEGSQNLDTSSLSFELKFGSHASLNLGRFRLSVTNDPAAFEHEKKRLRGMRMKLTDPWAKLAIAYQLTGDENALDELVKQHPQVAVALGNLYASEQQWEKAISVCSRAITDQTSDAPLLFIRGKAHSAMGQTDQAIADLKRFLELQPTEDTAELLADLLLQELHEGWTVLEPIEKKSEGGAMLTVLKDGSILASGDNPDHDLYTITARNDLTKITSIRLEALTHESLPKKGPGRDRSGNFVMDSLRLTGVSRATPDSKSEIQFDVARADFSNPDRPIRPGGEWHTVASGGAGKSHVAVYRLETGSQQADFAHLTFEMEFNHGLQWPHLHLGRFRLSVTDDPSIFDQSELIFAAIKLTDLWVKLAAAYQLTGDEHALDELVKQHPQAAVVRGDLYASEQQWEKAIATYGKLITVETTDTALLTKRAAVYVATEQWDLAKADWLRAIDQQPKQLQRAFDSFRKAEQWSTAAEFGQQVIAQKPKIPCRGYEWHPWLSSRETGLNMVTFVGKCPDSSPKQQMLGKPVWRAKHACFCQKP